MNYTKYQSFGFFLGLLMISILSCKKGEGYNSPVSDDTAKPEVVTNVKVDNFNGGSYITYDLPNSDNILYVLAKYKINETVTRETKASYYKDTVTVNGFANEQDYDVTLYTVTRANVMSDPVTVKVHPQTPVFRLVKPTLSLSADFGGVNVKAANPLKKEIGVIIVALDPSTKTMEVQDQFFTKAATIDYSIRGYQNVARDFGVYITDQWGNISDTLKVNVTPLFEELLDKSKFSTFRLGSDTPIGFNWQLPNLWNGKSDGDGWHTEFGNRAPFVATFSIGRTYKLSRFVLFERYGDEYRYRLGNPKDFSIWGSNVASPRDSQLPVLAAEGAVVGDWINLGNYHFPDPPSGLPPGSTNSADDAFVKAGVNFNISFNAPSVRYVRVAVANTWSGGDAAHIMEISLYGKPE